MATLVLFIEGSRLSNWEDCTITRTKSDHSGTFTVKIFPGVETLGASSSTTEFGQVRPDAKFHAYLASGALVFTGVVDSVTYDLSARDFAVTVAGRSPAATHVDGTHEMPNGGYAEKIKTKALLKLLNTGTGIKLDLSRVEDDTHDHYRAHTQGTVSDEMGRISRDAGHFLWSGRDGSLIFSPDTMRVSGPPIFTGPVTANITQAKVEITSTKEHKKRKTKGRRHLKDGSKRGKEAIVGDDKKHVTTESPSAPSAPSTPNNSGGGG